MKAFKYIIPLLVALSACTETYIPKERGYHKIDLPEHKYVELQHGSHPYSFEHSVYAKVQPHRKSTISEPHWIDLVYPQFGASIELTYKAVPNAKEFDKMLNDARKLTNKHNIKAYAIDETMIRSKSGVSATVFELNGEIPSQFQFYATDSSDHFFRGALYFKTSTKNDSLRPVINYLSYDIVHMLNTLSWNDSEPQSE